MIDLQHDHPFDPTYGYDLAGLLGVEPPPEPAGFVDFWTRRRDRAMAIDPAPRLHPSADRREGMHVWDLEYRSTDGFPIRGWLLEPAQGEARWGFVVGHGYGGLEAPDVPLPRTDAAYLVPCLRGLGRSARPPISTNPWWHVRHDIHQRDRYVLGGCVEDVWTGVSALLSLRPDLRGAVGFLGSSFGAGIGALALPWESRIAVAHLDVPSFGHQPLRLSLPTTGSAASVQAFTRENPALDVAETLAFYDSAVAAQHIRQPVLVSAAVFDPVVPPPGQFAVHNGLGGTRCLFVRSAGHHGHQDSQREDWHLSHELGGFLRTHEPRVSQLVQPAPRS